MFLSGADQRPADVADRQDARIAAAHHAARCRARRRVRWSSPRPGVAVARLIQPASQRLRSIDQWPVVMAPRRTRGRASRPPARRSPAPASPRAPTRGCRSSFAASTPMRFLAIIDLRSRLVAGRYDLSGATWPSGSTLASDLGVGVGDKLRVASTEGIEDVVDGPRHLHLGNEGVDGTWVADVAAPRAGALRAPRRRDDHRAEGRRRL